MKEFAAKKGMKYGDALKCDECRATYKQGAGLRAVARKMHGKGLTNAELGGTMAASFGMLAFLAYAFWLFRQLGTRVAPEEYNDMLDDIEEGRPRPIFAQFIRDTGIPGLPPRLTEANIHALTQMETGRRRSPSSVSSNTTVSSVWLPEASQPPLAHAERLPVPVAELEHQEDDTVARPAERTGGRVIGRRTNKYAGPRWTGLHTL